MTTATPTRTGMRAARQQLTPLPEDVRAALRNTNLAYMTIYKAGVHMPTSAAMRFDVHKDCIGRSVELPAGTMVYAVEHVKTSYSAYRRVGDEDYPAKDADVLYWGSDWTLVVMVEGVLHSAYVQGPKHETPKCIGKVGAPRNYPQNF